MGPSCKGEEIQEKVELNRVEERREVQNQLNRWTLFEVHDFSILCRR